MDKLLLVAFVAGVLYLGHAYFYPWRQCPRCKGAPRNSSRGAFNHHCWWCKSTGRRLRWGARLLGRGFGHL